VIFSLSRHDEQGGLNCFSIAKEFAKNNRVIFIDHPYTIKDFVLNDIKGDVRWRLKHFIPFRCGISKYRGDEASLYILSLPPVIPINYLEPGGLYNALQGINTTIIGKRIAGAIKKLSLKNIIYINAFNFYYPDLKKYIKPSLYIYYCIDIMIKPYSLRHGPRLENQLLKEVDVVITTAPKLQQAKKVINPNSYLVTNAADFNLSSKALSPSTSVASELKEFPKPIIGYLGSIERRIDYILIGSVARKNKEWTFVLVGPLECKYIPDELFTIPNIIFIKQQPYHVKLHEN